MNYRILICLVLFLPCCSGGIKHSNLSANMSNQSVFSAVQNGDLGEISALISKGADVNASRKDGVTPLILAAALGHTDILKVLLENGANVNGKTNDGVTALMMAAPQGYTKMVDILLGSGAEVNNTQYSTGETALTWTASKGHTPIVSALLNSGANPNTRRNDGGTALMLAAQNRHSDVVKTLLANGANVNAITNDGWTAESLAKERGQMEIVRILEESGKLPVESIELTGKVETRFINGQPMAIVKGYLLNFRRECKFRLPIEDMPSSGVILWRLDSLYMVRGYVGDNITFKSLGTYPTLQVIEIKRIN